MKTLLKGLFVATWAVLVLLLIVVVRQPEIWVAFFNLAGTWIWSLFTKTFFGVPLWATLAAYVLLSIFVFSLVPRPRAKSLSWSEKPIRRW